MNMNMDLNLFSCCDCDDEFQSHSELLQHYDSVHIPEYNCQELNQALVCPYCLRNFTDENNFSSHLDLHEFEGPLYSCEVCTKCFKSRKFLEFHQGEPLQKCTVCKEFIPKGRLPNHMKRHRNATFYECATCFDKILFPDIPTHMRAHNSDTGGKVSTCDECAKAFPTRKMYLLHKKRGHDNYPCDICLAVVFSSKEEWETHRQIHFAGSFPCTACQKVFTEIAGLRNHQEICYNYCHSNNATGNGTSTTTTVTNRNSFLQPQHQHQSKTWTVQQPPSNMNSNSSLPIEKCPYCPLNFANVLGFNSHLISSHVDLLAYQCTECLEIFIGQAAYNTHRQAAHPRISKCQLCANVFSSEEDLTAHLTTHRQIKAVFVCEACDVILESKAILLSHKQSHLTAAKVATSAAAATTGAGPSVRPPAARRRNPNQANPLTNHQSPNSNLLNNHQPNTTHLMVFKCLPCKLMFTNKDRLEEHNISTHGKIREPANPGNANSNPKPIASGTPVGNPKLKIVYKCQVCNLIFGTEPEFREHRWTTHQRMENCKACNLSFQTFSELNEHYLNCNKVKSLMKSTPIVYKPYQCTTCGKRFMLEGSLYLHSCGSKQGKLKQAHPVKKPCPIPEEDTDVAFVSTIG